MALFEIVKHLGSTNSKNVKLSFVIFEAHKIAKILTFDISEQLKSQF